MDVTLVDCLLLGDMTRRDLKLYRGILADGGHDVKMVRIFDYVPMDPHLEDRVGTGAVVLAISNGSGEPERRTLDHLQGLRSSIVVIYGNLKEELGLRPDDVLVLSRDIGNLSKAVERVQ